MNDKVKDFFKQSIGYFVVAFTCIIYILTALIRIEETGKTIAQIIADGVVAFLLGIFIARMFDLQGMMNGNKTSKVEAVRNAHSEMVTKVADYIDKLDVWCENENKTNYKVERTKILARAGLRYDDCFDENGVAKDWSPDPVKLENKLTKRLEKRKQRGYNKAVKLKLTSITSSELMSEGGKQNDKFNFGRTKAEYEKSSSLKDIVSKAGTAIIFGYYGVTLIQDFDYASLIWMALQVAIFLITGVIKMYQSYNFILDEYRGRIIKKIDNLQKFYNYINTTTEVKNVKQEETL